MTERIRKQIPVYVLICYILVWIVNCAAYFGGKFSPFTPISLGIAWDKKIPFAAPWILVYVLSFIQWAVGYFIIMKDSREACMRVFSGEMTAKVISFLFFVFLPVTIQRPEVTGSGLFDWMMRLIFTVDTPMCLFPSIHCLDSWICWRGTHYMKHVSKAYQALMLAFTLLVFIAVLLVKQHYIADILGGIAVVEIGLFLSRKLHLDQVLDRFVIRLEKRLEIRRTKEK